MFYLFTGNKLEILAEKYREHIYEQPVSDPMYDEVVVVQTQGMAAYLKQYLARHSGIAANLQMPFPRNFCERMIRQYSPRFEAARQNYSGIALTCHIYMILQNNPGRYPELARYISGELPELRRWQLAEQITSLFDNYQIYRYDDEAHEGLYQWQRRLFEDLYARTGSRSRDFFYREFCRAEKLPPLPPRVTVFGAGVLPPLYLDIFFKLASSTDVLFFYLSPCQEFWEDAYERRKENRGDFSTEDMENYNPLLASWGESGRQLFSLLLSRQDPEPYLEFDEFSSFITSSDPPVLHRLQESILHYDTVCGGTAAAAAGDDSLEIHNCHTPRREIEVLHDKLLAKINSGTAAPRDIIVMAPDINDYVRHIEAVFGQGPLRECYTVSDRKLRRSSVVAMALEKLLKLRNSRLSSTEVLELLNIPVIGNAWGIGESEVEVIRKWIDAANIRWGADGEDRFRICEVEFEEYSWFPALDRMLRHFAFGKSAAEEAVDGECPLKEDQLALYGRFRTFLNEVCQLRRDLAAVLVPEQWLEVMKGIFDRFFEVKESEDVNDFALIRQFVDTQLAAAKSCGFSTAVPVDVVSGIISGFLDLPGERFSFLRGRITFCSLTPLRNIPSKIIAVLGLNCRAFPRRDRTTGFNLMAATRRNGDHSAARDDNYLFLEALLSARENFWLFYNGRSPRDNSELYPSPLLAELAEYVQKHFGIEEIKQMLQPFDPIYFSGKNDKLFSFSPENYEAAANICFQSEPAAAKPLAELVPLPEKLEMPESIALENLINWAKEPAEYWLKNILNVSLFTARNVEDSEPFEFDSLQKYSFRSNIFALRMFSQDKEWSYRQLYNANKLKVGINGRKDFDEVCSRMNELDADLINQCMAQEKVPALFCCGDVEISGMLTASRDRSSQIIVKFGDYKHKFHVEALLCHWALLRVSDAPVVETRLICFPEKGKPQECVCFRNVPGAAAMEGRWQQLLKLYAGSFYRLPFLLPSTLFKMGTEPGHDEVEIIEAAVKELKGERYVNGKTICEPPPLTRFFSPELINNKAVIKELQMLCELFYGQEGLC